MFQLLFVPHIVCFSHCLFHILYVPVLTPVIYRVKFKSDHEVEYSDMLPGYQKTGRGG